MVIVEKPGFNKKKRKNAEKRLVANTVYGETHPVQEISVKVTEETIQIIPISDIHIGDKQLNIKMLKSIIQYIKDTPNAYTIINGDLLDMALKTSKSDVYGQAVSPTEQVLAATELLEPIKDKILLIVRGNHEYRNDKDTGSNPLYALCASLGKLDNYAGDTYNLIVKNSKGKILSILGTHGSGIKGFDGPSIMKSIRNFIFKTYRGFHWYLFSHKHVPFHFEEEIVPDSLGEEKRLQKIIVDMLPAMLNSGAGYATFYNFALSSQLQKIYEWDWKHGEPNLTMYDFVPRMIENAKKNSRPKEQSFLEQLEKDSKKALDEINQKYGSLNGFFEELKRRDEEIRKNEVKKGGRK